MIVACGPIEESVYKSLLLGLSPEKLTAMADQQQDVLLLPCDVSLTCETYEKFSNFVAANASKRLFQAGPLDRDCMTGFFPVREPDEELAMDFLGDDGGSDGHVLTAIAGTKKGESERNV